MTFLDRPRPRWFTIPAHRPFVEDLAAGLYAALSPLGPEALSDAVVLTPTRRGARALVEAFLRVGSQKALLPPQVRALGDLDEGEPPFEPGDIALDLPPAISPWRRRFELARLVSGASDKLGRGLDAAGALELADALAGFLDSVEIEEAAPLAALDGWVDLEMAKHWEISADFLRLAVDAWPARLRELGLTDVTARRVALLRALGRRWRDSPPPGVMVAAGSTGTAPAAAALLTAIAEAPQGAVVLPGLDQDLAEDAWRKVGEQHPQGAMKRLLALAGVERGDVAAWSPPTPGDGRGRWRRRIINEALRPPEATADWLSQISKLKAEGAAESVDPIAEGLTGLSIVVARHEEEAAGAVALLLREALETPGRTAALVTPDAALARRVSARLSRWGVVADSSAGAPLAGFTVGVLASVLAKAAVDPFDPVLLLALAKHPLARFGLEAEDLAHRAARLERSGLRGPRAEGWAPIERRLSEAGDGGEAVELLSGLRRVAEIARAPFAGGLATAPAAARALAEAMEALAAEGLSADTGKLWSGAGGEAAASLIAALIEEGDGLPKVTPSGFSALIDGLLAGETVRTGAGSHPRLHVLGAIEARLVRADLIVLAGLEEGVWPAAAPVDPFLSRPMRKTAGLPPPERRIGLSAHDFAQAACAPEVVLLRSERRGGAPAVASRWLWRLETLARGAGAAIESRPEVLDWVRALDEPGAFSPAPRPKPTPPLEARPRKLSVTGVERWIRDPYGFYARSILNLRPLERPGEPVEARARGTAIHAAFERFAIEHAESLPEAAHDIFAAYLMEALEAAGMPGARLARERALAVNVAPWVVDFERRRREGAQLLVEQQGELEVADNFILTAKADRIEVRAWAADVLDFKTGSPPSKKQVDSGLAPQLTLTAAILRHGGFAGVGQTEANELVYVRVSGGRVPGLEIVRGGGEESPDLAERALEGLRHRIAAFDDPAQGYLSWAAPQFINQYPGDYDHLARLWEWHVIGEGESEGAGNEVEFPSARQRSVASGRMGLGYTSRRRAPNFKGSGMTADPQIAASDPGASVFVTANAGSGKTTTLVNRVARLLLGETPPEAILCLTYTKAAAAEMQRRLFDELGAWAVMEDAPLAKKLAALNEDHQSYSDARMLFAKALETPGGLKIQTIHAFCEKLLRRFPLEAGVSPGFKVLEAAAAAEVSAKARDALALAATAAPDGAIGRAYAHFSVELDWNSFGGMFSAFEARRTDIAAYAEACGDDDGLASDVWRRCGFDAETPPETLEAEAVADVEWGAWTGVAEAMMLGTPASDQPIGVAMKAVTPQSSFAEVWAIFSTQKGEPRARVGTSKVAKGAVDWMSRTQFALNHARGRIKAARIARDTVFALTLARAYAELYEAAKAEQAGLDFGDLIQRTRELLTVRVDAAWVLYKLDGGIDHLLLDEAQDTAPDQWDILHAFTDEFFAGAGAIRFGERSARRTIFAVGDEKQSIYSFQGAAPERFLAEEGDFRSLVEGAGETFLRVPLERSWRSAPEVLSFVDAVFADPAAAAGLRPGAPTDEPVHHLAVRTGGGGVDLWPLEVSDEAEETDPWLPVDHQQTQSASKKLARNIAREIKRMVLAREGVFARSGGARRPMDYGDVLILVRRRNTLFHEIIRALKREGVPVGGADRLKLSEHIAFQDLLAMGRFARFPADDLTLAALLRSPFCDVDEAALFDLAYQRQGSLWNTLLRRAVERPAFGRAVDLLTWVLAEARTRAPFDLYSRLLSRLDPEGRSMRERTLIRLGREAEDAIDAFLAELLAAEQVGARDLEQVLDRLAASEIEVKREQEDRSGPEGGEVRVMTAHGAKGLEAPVVILPDTTTKAKAMAGPLLSVEGGGFLWAPRKDDDCPATEEARARREEAAAHESLRLLYVAMTRARDRLIVCGVETRKASFEGSWRDVIERGLERPQIVANRRMIVQGDMQVIRYGADPVVVSALARSVAAAVALPAWARRLAPQEPAALRYASPSTLAEDERGPSNSPLAVRDGLGRYRRGTVIHRLLQLLPDLPVERRAAAAAVLLDREPDLNPAQRAEMAQAALSVLNDARFAAVFGPGSRPEAAIAGRAAGLPEGLAVSGRVDRLVVEPDRVLVVDFKTNRPAPDRIEDADRAYKVQMAVYAAVLAEVFPGRRIEAALVWTDGPKLMAVPENIIAETLAALRAES